MANHIGKSKATRIPKCAWPFSIGPQIGPIGRYDFEGLVSHSTQSPKSSRRGLVDKLVLRSKNCSGMKLGTSKLHSASSWKG